MLTKQQSLLLRAFFQQRQIIERRESFPESDISALQIPWEFRDFLPAPTLKFQVPGRFTARPIKVLMASLAWLRNAIIESVCT